MKGRVIKYFDEKGYGFIKDEDGESRFFHIKQVKGINEISLGSLVEFTPHHNEKGLNCLDIEVLTRKESNFISIGHTNLKVSNIKEFGISQDGDQKKAIKVPIYKLNPDYVVKESNAGKNLLKKLFLPSMYIETDSFVEIPISDFSIQTLSGNEFRSPQQQYKLPYRVVKTAVTKTTKDQNYVTVINEDEAKVVYWEYLYITTYQNDNYQFYGYEIDIEETLSQLNELV